MRKLIAIDQITLDGIMQAPGGPEEDPRSDFKLGGWVRPFFGDEDLFQAIDKTIAGDFDMLFGRRTYEVFAGYWPKQSNSIAKAFNKATKYVVTGSLDQLDWKRSFKIGGDIVDEVRRLKASEGPDLQLWGSWQLLQTLIAAGLIDEYIVMVYPVLLGKGKRLFENGLPPSRLSLVGTIRTSKGVLYNTYRLAGPYKP